MGWQRVGHEFATKQQQQCKTEPLSMWIYTQNRQTMVHCCNLSDILRGSQIKSVRSTCCLSGIHFLFLISPNDLSLPKTTVVVSWWLWENHSNMYNRSQNACLLWKNRQNDMCPFKKNVLYLSRVYCCLFIGRYSFTISRVSSFFHQKWCSGWWPHLVLLIPHTQLSFWVSDTGYRLMLLHNRSSPIH